MYIALNSVQSADVGGNLFACDTTTTISILNVCDGVHNCPNEAYDELGCNCNNTINYSSQCKHVYDSSGRDKCSLFYQTTKNLSCHFYSFSRMPDTVSNTDDLQEDHDTFSSKRGCKNLTTICVEPNINVPNISDRFGKICTEKGQLPCRNGHSECYEIHEICVYKLNTQRNLIPCATGEHRTHSTMFCLPMYHDVQMSWVLLYSMEICLQ